MSATCASRISAAILAVAIVAATWLPTVIVTVPHAASNSLAVAPYLA